jgi:hypothetical protein
MPYRNSNASYQALQLLGQFFGSDVTLLRDMWATLCDLLRESNETIRIRDNSWEQDWLLAKYGADAPFGTRGWYSPPADLHAFPTFDIDIHTIYLADRAGVTVRHTQSHTDLTEIFSRTGTSFAGPVALEAFHELRSQLRSLNNPLAQQLHHTLAWVTLGLGHLFGGVVLEPTLDLDFALAAMDQRWREVWSERDVFEDTMSGPEILQFKLDVFYGAMLDHNGFKFQTAQQGQPWSWQQYWRWLAGDIDPERARAAVRMAARLMICPPVLVFLKTVLSGQREGVTDYDRVMALGILRRLTLQLQAMAWFEHALEHEFADVRVQDLASFAFSAVRPHWPRRLLALSHRSRDVKNALMQLQLWGNFRFCIDALFLPQWETNVGTVWGLFSAVPGLVRIPSPHYEDSEWCRREREIFDYLCEYDDFLRGRHVIELEPTQLTLLDAQVPTGSKPNGSPFTPGNFPPLTTVWTVYPFEDWECRLLACASVTRSIFMMLRNAAETGVVCHLLARGELPTGPPLTNHPDGWAPIMTLFRTFAEEWSDDPNIFPLVIDDEQYKREDLVLDLSVAQSPLDLSDGAIDQPAVFAALEWNRTIAPAQIENERYGKYFAIDYRRIDLDRWRSDEYMVIRGVNRVLTIAPLWILQRADQRVDEWPGIGKNPIFTQHAEKQWNWMVEALDEPQWPDSYRKQSKLLFAPRLTAALKATSTRGNAYYQGKV